MDYVVVSNSEIWSFAMFEVIKSFFPDKKGTYLVGEYDMDYLLGEDLEFLFFDFQYLEEYKDRLKKQKFIKVKNLVCISLDEEPEKSIPNINYVFRKTNLENFKSILSGKEIESNSEYNVSERDMSILFLLKRGASNKEIGEKLYLSEKTIKNNLTRIYRELGVTNRYEAMIKLNSIETK